MKSLSNGVVMKFSQNGPENSETCLAKGKNDTAEPDTLLAAQ